MKSRVSEESSEIEIVIPQSGEIEIVIPHHLWESCEMESDLLLLRESCQ